MASSNDFDVEKTISKLLEAKSTKPGKQVNLTENEIKALCTAVRDIFISQPTLLELEAPLKVCGTLKSVLYLLHKSRGYPWTIF